MAELLEAHPDGRAIEHQLGDVVRCAAFAVRRGAHKDAETWVCYALGHARVKQARGTNAAAAFWWALTRARALSDLEADVTPNLEEQLENAARVVASEADPVKRTPSPEEEKPGEVPAIGEVLGGPDDPLARARKELGWK